jgi:hypothetical protein
MGLFSGRVQQMADAEKQVREAMAKGNREGVLASGLSELLEAATPEERDAYAEYLHGDGYQG